MGLIPIRGQAVLEPSSCGFPGAQRARTRVLGRGCKCQNSQASHPASCSLSRPASHRASLPASMESAREPCIIAARRANCACTYRFCRWGSTGPARTQGPRTQSVDTRTPRTALPRWPRSGTARTGTPATQATVRGSVSTLCWSLTHFPSPWGQGLRLRRLPWARVHQPAGDRGCSLPPSSTPGSLCFY